MKKIGKKSSLAIVTASFLILALPLANAAHSDFISSVDWTLHSVNGEASYWSACVTINTNRPAANLPYTVQYGTYIQSGTLDHAGCFSVTIAQISPTFSYGALYTIKAGTSTTATLTASTSATLGGDIISINRLAFLTPMIGMVTAAVAAVAIGAALYIRRKP